MTTRDLKELFPDHRGKVSDKWTSYLAAYDQYLTAWRDKPVTLLEIGIQNGGSLEIWAKYFPNAKAIVGCDVNPACASLSYADPRISVVIGDVNNKSVQHEIESIARGFDIVIDDGSHASGSIIKSFAAYFPMVADDGIYVVEDLHCSYWAEYGGGLFHSHSSVSFLKTLIDILNREHWGVDAPPGQILQGFVQQYGITFDEASLETIHSLTIANSVCLIRKKRPELNLLGARLVVGSSATVAPGQKNLHLTPTLAPSQAQNPWSSFRLQEDLAKLGKRRASNAAWPRKLLRLFAG